MSTPDQPASPPLVATPEIAVPLLQSIDQIIRLISQKNLSYEKRLDKVLQIILDYLGVEQGSIMALEKNQTLTVIAASRKELLGLNQSLTGDSIAAWVANSRTPVFIPDISKDPRFQARGGGSYRKNALLSVPVLDGGKLTGVINISDKEGEKDLLQEDIAFLFNFSGMILSILTQQKLQKELANQKNILKKRNLELRRQEKLRGELTRLLVHDLKGPLSEVVANLDILSYSIAAENREFLESAQMSCDRTVRMVSNLVAIDKIEDGKMKLFKGEVRPEALLAEAVSAIKGLARIKNVELVLETTAEEELPLILLDRILILRVLQNLLTNALGYTNPNTTIRVGCRPVPLKKRLEFYVADQGPGVPLDRQGFIFDKYARASEKHDILVGTGLGLYFCRLAVELHRGSIALESQVGQGSRFSFVLPI